MHKIVPLTNEEEEVIYYNTKERVRKECSEYVRDLGHCVQLVNFPLFKCRDFVKRLRECTSARSTIELLDEDRRNYINMKKQVIGQLKNGQADDSLLKELTGARFKGKRADSFKTC